MTLKKKIYNLVIALLTLTLINSCKNESNYSTKHSIINADTIVRIEFKKTNSCKSDFDDFSISDRKTIIDFVSNINNAPIAGPWKGNCWNYIIFKSKNHSLRISTNDKVFGHGRSGIFYKLSEPGIIEKLRKIN